MQHKLNPTDPLSKEQLQTLFSATDEYTVTQALLGDLSVKRDEYTITHADGQSLIIYRPTLQTLIRHIHQMGYNAGHSGRGTKG